MTATVDYEGQEIVRNFSKYLSALKGFHRLKGRDLHCSVISTPQLDIEEKARVLMTWLHDIAADHPASAFIVVQAVLST